MANESASVGTDSYFALSDAVSVRQESGRLLVVLAIGRIRLFQQLVCLQVETGFVLETGFQFDGVPLVTRGNVERLVNEEPPTAASGQSVQSDSEQLVQRQQDSCWI